MCVACRCIRQVSARTPASLISAVSCARLQPPLPVRGRERHGDPLLINLLVGNVKGKEARACVNAGKRRGKKRKLEAAMFSVLYRAKIFRGWKFYSWADTKTLPFGSAVRGRNIFGPKQFGLHSPSSFTFAQGEPPVVCE